MATLSAKAPDGKTLSINVPDGADPSQYDSMVDDAMNHYQGTQLKDAPNGSQQAAPASTLFGVDTSLFQNENQAPQLPPGYGVQTATKALLTNQPTSNMGEAFLRGLPAMAATGLGVATGPAAIPEAGLLASAGEGLRQMAVQGAAPFLNQDQSAPGQVVANMGAQGLAGAAGKAIPIAAAATRDYVAQSPIGTNIPPSAYQFAKNNLAKVVSFMGVGPGDLDTMAENFRAGVQRFASAAEEQYRAVANNLTDNSADAAVNNLPFGKAPALQSAVKDISQSFGYEPTVADSAPATKVSIFGPSGERVSSVQTQPGVSPGVQRVAVAKDVGLFNQFANQIRSNLTASPRDVYFFQRDLQNAIDSHEGEPIAAALGQLKEAVMGHISDLGSAGNVDPQLAQLSNANAAYAGGKELEAVARKSTNANDLVAYVKRTMGSPFNTIDKQALTSVGNQVPEAGKAIGDIQAASAAQQFQPILRGMPATGYSGAVGQSVIVGGLYANKENIKEHPIMSTALGLAALGLSPRMSLMALQGSNLVSPAITQAMSHMGAASIAAYYKSPSQP